MLTVPLPLYHQLRYLAASSAFQFLASREPEQAQRRRIGFRTHRLHLGQFTRHHIWDYY